MRILLADGLDGFHQQLRAARARRGQSIQQNGPARTEKQAVPHQFVPFIPEHFLDGFVIQASARDIIPRLDFEPCLMLSHRMALGNEAPGG